MIRRVLHSFAANYIPGVVQIPGPSELRWEWLKLRVAPLLLADNTPSPRAKARLLPQTPRFDQPPNLFLDEILASVLLGLEFAHLFIRY